ncbi:hypothetical protein JK358_34815 [Nocardia sp. 2]|uniref:Uncharacterized protein n=1 Tax=Nocardia acididurans TaxID=2802282 RepID=A0ABS1MG83_9NOCA|nr:hypothetical protein [Nocardia acididurans]MBL1079589.1 hypothetical protein [Nocardia acididurans]
MADSNALDLTAPTDTIVFRVWAIRHDHVDTDAEAAGRLAGLVAELAALDPIWTGAWTTRWRRHDSRVCVSIDQPGFEQLFNVARADGDWTADAPRVDFTISTAYGASIGTHPIVTMPVGAQRRVAGEPTSWLSFDIRPKPTLAEAGLITCATSGAIGLALFDAVGRWFEPDAFFYVPLQADKISSAVRELVHPLGLFRMIDKATDSYIRRLRIGWLNQLPPDTHLDIALLPGNAIVTTEPRTGGTVIRLGDSPWLVTDEDYFALRNAVGLPNPDQIVDVRGLDSDERRAVEPPYFTTPVAGSTTVAATTGPNRLDPPSAVSRAEEQERAEGSGLPLNLRFAPEPENAPRFASDIVEATEGITGTRLDYTPASLATVDSIIEMFRSEGVPSEAVAETLFGFGCYIGEVMCRHAGGKWQRPPEQTAPFSGPMVVAIGDQFANPIDKAFKRMDNGEQDSIVFFYQAMTTHG